MADGTRLAAAKSDAPAAGRSDRPARHFDITALRDDFPIFSTTMHGQPLAFLDSAASAQKPRAVIERILRFYEAEYANIHRGLYELSARATEEYESVREKARRFLNAPQREEIVFVRGTTEAINLVAGSWGRRFLAPGDAIVLSEIEHHSNIVPWQLLAEEKGLEIRVLPVTDEGEIRVSDLDPLLADGRVRFAGLAHVSNAIGTELPVAELIARLHEAGAKVLIDGAQAVPHQRVDVRALDADFYVFSGHKLFGPTGVGVLWARSELLAVMPPWQGGGDMIDTVSFAGSSWAEPPHRFEAGTPNIAGVIGLGAAFDWLEGLDLEAAFAHEQRLHGEAERALRQVEGLRIIGEARAKGALTSFVIDGTHPHDVATILDREGVAVRAGHHCAQPTMERFGVPGTVRASFAIYNREEDVEALLRGIARVKKIFG
ncbi:MAG: cysteine desulfurase [Alphaproteobacteria bacterium]|nr:MAG: cysteine desulfurase [Alphaproteobacteria bacterium]